SLSRGDLDENVVADDVVLAAHQLATRFDGHLDTDDPPRQLPLDRIGNARRQEVLRLPHRRFAISAERQEAQLRAVLFGASTIDSAACPRLYCGSPPPAWGQQHGCV